GLLELRAQMLVLRRELQRLAERLARLVDGEADVAARQLEEHAARLAEVDRVEVRAVDDRRRAGAAVARTPAEGFQLGGIGGRPRDVVHRAGAGDGALGRRRVVGQVPGSLRAGGAPVRALAGE